jgi:hypothetical protein
MIYTIYYQLYVHDKNDTLETSLHKFVAYNLHVSNSKSFYSIV